MFDFHTHSTVSFDGRGRPEEMVRAAQSAGLREICFTDHIDYDIHSAPNAMAFDTAVYNAAYDHLEAENLKIRFGMEYGLRPHNQEQFLKDLQRRPFDFVLGSVHFVGDLDVYYAEFWKDKSVAEAERQFLEETLTCVQAHDQFDVLAHLTFLSKSPYNTAHTRLEYSPHQEIVDEILRALVKKGKGLELNTSGMDRCGGYLPTADFFRRFKQLGGEIVTVGSDAHAPDRVGQYTADACTILKEIFGYVCTFENRSPIFHKL